MAIKNAANIKAALVKYIDGKFRFQDAQTWTADEIKSLTDWLGSEGLNPFRLRTAKTALEEFVIACVQRYRNEHMKGLPTTMPTELKVHEPTEDDPLAQAKLLRAEAAKAKGNVKANLLAAAEGFEKRATILETTELTKEEKQELARHEKAID
jgi:hypothetical protein